jgi:hypothetical protein
MSRHFILLTIFAGLVGAFMPSFFSVAHAEDAYWRTTPDTLGTFYWSDNPSSDSFSVETDNNGVHYWLSPADLSVLRPFTANDYISLPTTGYYLWIFASNPFAVNNNYMMFYDAQGNYHNGTVSSLISSFSVDGNTIYSVKMGGVGAEWPQPLTRINTMSSGGSTRTYAIVYTNEDLSYIDTQDKLYHYLSVGTQNDLNFTSPKGNYTQSPYIPVFTALYNYFASSTWNYIDVEVSKHATTATSSIIATLHTYGHIEDTSIGSHVLTFGNTEFDTGCYTYRGRFMTQIGGLPPTPVYINYSNYFENSDWQFCIGTGTSLTLPTGEQCDDYGTIGGALCRIALWLFIPKPETLQKFADLKAIFETKAPFSYYFAVRNEINNLNASSTPIFSLPEMGALYTQIFLPLKIGLGLILWLLFAVWIIKRIGRFDF